MAGSVAREHRRKAGCLAREGRGRGKERQRRKEKQEEKIHGIYSDRKKRRERDLFSFPEVQAE